MICSEFYNGSGLGNQLWSYVLTRIIADKKNCPFSIISRERFKGHDFMHLDFGEQLVGGSSPEGGPPTSLPNGIKHYYREKKEVLRGTNIDISRTDYGLLNISTETKIDGNFQSTKYLEGYRDKVREWLGIKSNPLQHDICVINFRGGEYVGIKDVFLPQKYWDYAVANMRLVDPNLKFLVITDDKKTAKQFFPDFPVRHLGIEGDYLAIYNASYLILANTSFAFFPAWTGIAKKIIAPKYWAQYNLSNGYWSTSDIISDNFTYLDREGKVFSAEECRREKESFESTHADIFETVAPGYYRRSLVEKIKRTIPIPVKYWLKNSIRVVRMFPGRLNDALKDYTRQKISPEQTIAYRKTIKIYDILRSSMN